MSTYLPTISCLIEDLEIPSETPDSYHDITHLLEKYWTSESYYSCSTRNYVHTEYFLRLAKDSNLRHSAIYNDEVGFLTSEEASFLKADLCKLEAVLVADDKVAIQRLIMHETRLQQQISRRFLQRARKNEKSHFKEIKNLKQLDLRRLTNQAPTLREISEFDLIEEFEDEYHPVISTLYWLKTQIHLLGEADDTGKAFMYVVLCSD